MICQVAHVGLEQLTCRAHQPVGRRYRCEATGPHEWHAVGDHTTCHAVVGEHYTCEQVETIRHHWGPQAVERTHRL